VNRSERKPVGWLENHCVFFNNVGYIVADGGFILVTVITEDAVFVVEITDC